MFETGKSLSAISKFDSVLEKNQPIYICLATFAATYDVIQSSTKTTATEDVNTKEEMQNAENDNSLIKMKLQKGSGVIRKRKQEAILHTRRCKIHAESEKYYHSKILLLLPMES